MHASLNGTSLKQFTKALTCLTKYGDELALQVHPDALELSVINSAKSAFVKLRLLRELFDKFVVPELADDESVAGSLQTKALLSNLRPSSGEKSIESVELQLQYGDEDDELETKLLIKIHCKKDATRTHRLPLAHADNSEPVLHSDQRNRVSIGARAVREVLEHFPASRANRSDPQLTWEFDQAEVRVRTRPAVADKSVELSTQLSISSDIFDAYDISDLPLNIAFPLREFAAATSLAEALSTPLDLSMSEPGEPLLLQIEHSAMIVTCIISTSTVTSAQGSTQQSAVAIAKRQRTESVVPPAKRRASTALVMAAPSRDASMAVKSRETSAAPDYSAFNPLAESTPRPPTQPNGVSTPLAGARQPLFLKGSSSFQPRSIKDEPLFLPASTQLTQHDEEVLRATGLGDMDADDVADMMAGLEDDFLEDEMPSTQAPPSGRDFCPLFED
ncbi:hypothetical protein AURDEDRAFT_151347 [Auricularia subglabra TFB-10046 SS5]|nr:hypothetical protein AURDEDRAFT_151347 [Auricularia subglabra TFB-10046 SS5]